MSIARTRSPPSSSAGRARALERARELARRCAARGCARSRRAPRRRRGSRPGVGCEVVGSSVARAQALVEVVRAELDVVAEALVAEADVQRHDAPVREALRRLGEVGGRVEDDRRVLGGQLHVRPPRRVRRDGSRRRSRRAARPCAGRRPRRPRCSASTLAQARRGGEADDGRRRAGLAHRARRLDAVEAGQPVVHQHDVGPELARRRPTALPPSGTEADDLDVAAQRRAAARAPRGRRRCPRRARPGSARSPLETTRRRAAVGSAAGRPRGRRARARGAAAASSSTRPVERRRVLAGEERQHVARLARAGARRRSRGDLVEGRRRRRPASPSSRPRYSPSRTATPSSSTSREAIVTSPVATPASASCIAAAFSSRRALGVERDHRREPGRDRARRHDAHRLRRRARRPARPRGSRSSCSAARRPRSPASPRRRRAMSAVEGFIVWPPSTIRVAPRLSNRRRLPSPATTATTPALAPPSGTRCEQPLLALLGLLVHVRDLDPLDRPRAPSRARARRRGRRCGRAPSARSRRRRRAASRRAARAPPRARPRRAPRPRPRRRCSSGSARAPGGPRRRPSSPAPTGASGSGLARDRRGEPAHDLEQPGAARVDDAGLAQDVEQLRRARERVLAALDERGAAARRRLEVRRAWPRPPRPARGSRSASSPRPACARRGRPRRSRARNARAIVGASIAFGLAEHLGDAAHDLGEDDAGVAARAHQRRARRARARAPRGRRPSSFSSASTTARTVSVRFVPGVAVGDRIDVEVVDPRRGSPRATRARHGRAADRLEVAHARPLHVLDVHLDRGDAQTRQPLDLVGDAASAPSPRPRRG